MRRSEDPKKAAVERQKRYREARQLVSIDLASATAATLRQLRERTTMNTDALVAAALALFADQLDKRVSSARARPPKAASQAPMSPSVSVDYTATAPAPDASPGGIRMPTNITPNDPPPVAQPTDPAPAAQPAKASRHQTKEPQPLVKPRKEQRTTSQVQPPLGSGLDLFGNPPPLPPRRSR